MAGYIPGLSSGVSPQGVVLIRARVDPAAFVDPGNERLVRDSAYECPPGVPVFTTQLAMSKMHTNEDALIPVFFDFGALPMGNRSKSVFVGISYGSGSKKHPVVAVATAGSVTVPHCEADFQRLVGVDVRWRFDTRNRYRSETGPAIASPFPFVARGPRAGLVLGNSLCRFRVQSATARDCTIILG